MNPDKLPAAITATEQALAAGIEAFGESRTIAKLRTVLGFMLMHTSDRLADAEPHLHAALKHYEHVCPGSLDVANAQMNLAKLCELQDRKPEAAEWKAKAAGLLNCTEMN